MSMNWVTQAKSVIDTLHGTNMRVEAEFEDGVLVAILLKVLPLSSNVVYKISVDKFRNLSFELQTTS